MSDAVTNAIAGACGGLASTALTYPLITVSTRNQVQAKSLQEEEKKRDKITFAKIIKEEGIRGLYSGVESSLFGIAITQGVYYYFYELCKSTFEAGKTTVPPTLSIAESMTVGALSGAACSIITNPIWVINTRLTVAKKSSSDTSSDPTFLSTARAIVKEEGPTGFYKGIVPALVLVSNPIIQYTVFEKLKEKLLKSRAGQELTSIHFFLLGAISKLCATGLTYPYIVVKSRMQVNQTKDQKYSSILDGFRKIFKQEGIPGFYKGISSKLLQSVLSSAFLFSLKEEFFKIAVMLLVFLKLRVKS